MLIKKILLSAACVVVLSSAQVSAVNVKYFSNDCKIQSALTLLDNAGACEIFDNLRENSVKIIFYDLTQISFSYKNHFAINSTDLWGNRYILINMKYRNAPIEQIACLIAHESCHKGKIATLDEETKATRTEAQYWSILKKHNVEYSQTALLVRLNSLSNLEHISTVSHDYIQEKISNSSFYKNQLAVRDRRKM